MALGKDYDTTLSTVLAIGIVFWKKAEYDTALEWYQRALRGQEEAHGIGHLEAAKIVGLIAAVFWKKGAYSKAVEWYQRALDDQEKAFGKYHPRVLCTVRDLGLVFRDMGEYGKAQGCHDRTPDCLKILGKDHPVSFWLRPTWVDRTI